MAPMMMAVMVPVAGRGPRATDRPGTRRQGGTACKEL